MSAITRGYILYLERTRQYRPHTVSGGFGTISPSNRCTKVTPRWRKTIPIRYIETNCIINTYLHVEYMWNNCVLYIYIEYIYTYIYICTYISIYIYIYYIPILHMNMYIYMYIIALPHLERMLLSKKKNMFEVPQNEHGAIYIGNRRPLIRSCVKLLRLPYWSYCMWHDTSPQSYQYPCISQVTVVHIFLCAVPHPA